MLMVFIGEAVVPSLFFYGFFWRFMFRQRPAPAWLHVLTVTLLIFAGGVVRMFAGFLFGGPFALEGATAWGVVVPASLSAFAALLVRYGLGPVTAQASMAASPAAQASPTAPELIPAAAPPLAAGRPYTPPTKASPWLIALVVLAAIAALFACLAFLVLLDMADQGRSQPQAGLSPPPAAAAPQIVDPYRQTPEQRRRHRLADSQWIAAFGDWESRNQMWLSVPGARQAMLDAVDHEELAAGRPLGYSELLTLAERRARREIFERTKIVPRQCPAGQIPDPAFDGACNLSEAVEANRQNSPSR